MMKDHKTWVRSAVSEQDSTMADHSANLQKSLLATAAALDEQLKKVKAIAEAIKVHTPATAPSK